MTIDNKNQNDKINFELNKSFNIKYKYGNKPINRINPSSTYEGKYRLLDELKNEIQSINDCEIKKNAGKLVFGEGNIFSDLMIVGEAPGEKEDGVGKPFVGDAGILLNKMLKAINLNREKLYLTNVVNFRPPNNRRPEIDEITRYSYFIKKHISIIKPKILLLLGSVAMEALLGSKAKITHERGKWKEIIVQNKTFLTMASFHPAYLLRLPEKKKEAWVDLQELQKKIKELKLKF